MLFINCFMKKLACFFAMLCCFGALEGQSNLIENPSFEEYFDCEYNFISDKLETVIPSWNALRRTPYYYNSECSITEYVSFEITPYDGSGFVVGSNSVYLETDSLGLQQRQYLQTALIENLIQDEHYYLSFYISPGELKSQAISHLGVRFTENLELNPYYSSFPFYPYLIEPTLEIDTIIGSNTSPGQWTKVEFCFSADSNSNIMQVGYFSPIDTMKFDAPVSGNFNFTAYDAFELYHIPSFVSLELNSNDTICVNNCVLFSSDHSLIPGTFDWTFQGGNINTSSLSEVEVCYDSPGTYDVSLFIEHCGVSIDTLFSEAITVLPSPSYQLTFQDTLICPLSTVLVDLSEIMEDVIWNDNSQLKIRELQEGNYNFIIDNGFCFEEYSFEIEVLYQIEERQSIISICPDDTLTIESIPIFQDTILFDTIFSILQCDSIYLETIVELSESVNLDFEDLFLCKDQTQELELPSSIQNVTMDNVAISSPISFNSSGSYLIAWNDENDCFFEDTIQIIDAFPIDVTTDDLLDITFNSDLQIIPEYQGDIISYEWSGVGELSCDNCPFPFLLEPIDGIYQVKIVDEYGCTFQNSMFVQFLENSYYLANTISPHSEFPENRSFYLQSKIPLKYDLSVYDRWGNILFEGNKLDSNHSEQGWNPEDEYNSGVFAYLIKIYDHDEVLKRSGSISIIR